MADPKGFLNHGREVARTRPVEERVKGSTRSTLPGLAVSRSSPSRPAVA